MAVQLHQRQAKSTHSSIASLSKAAATTARSTTAKAAATPSGTAPKTSSHASATGLSGTLETSLSTAPGIPEHITVWPSLPDYTATASSAYKAHGVNATFNSTFTPSGTVTTGTATKLPAGAIVGIPGPQPTGSQIGEIPDDFIACRVNGSSPKQGPFCTPEYAQNLWVNNVYAVTWNSDLFPLNATNHIEIHNSNSTSKDPTESLIYNSTLLPNPHGYMNIYMSHNFLRNLSGNYTGVGMNMSFFLYSTPAGGVSNRTIGPITTLTLNPLSLPQIKLKNPIPVKKGLEIGLPIGLVALVIIALSLWCGMRKHRRNWTEMRHYGKDYMRKRKRGKRAKGEGIELNDYDFDSNMRADRFEDEPTTGGGGGANEFREEMERQRKEERRNRAAKVSSF